jgi:hypothetical protein
MKLYIKYRWATGISEGRRSAKLTRLKVPYTCQTLRRLTHRDAENAYIKERYRVRYSLDREIVAAEDNIVVETTEDGEQEVFDIPEYPVPYFRGKNGGVYVRVRTDDGEDAVNIYEHDFYIVKRLYDPAKGNRYGLDCTFHETV